MATNLVSLLLQSTGLPLEIAERMFNNLLLKYNKTADSLTIDELREIMADFMQDVLVEEKNNSLYY